MLRPAVSGGPRGWSLLKQLCTYKRRGVSTAAGDQSEQSTQQSNTAGIHKKWLAPRANCARSNFAQLCKIHTCTPSREQGTGVPLACLHRGRRACSHQVQARACCQHRSAFYDCDYLPTASMCRHRPGQETRCAHNSGTRLCQIHACAYTRSTTNVMHAVASMSTSHAELRPSSLLPQARGSFS